MMLALSGNSALVVVWIAFAGVCLAFAAAVLVWAVRARQFADQDAARYLPLRSGLPDASLGEAAPKPDKLTGQSGKDRHVP